MKRKHWTLFFTLILAITSGKSFAQSLDYGKRLEIVLNDNTPVILYGVTGSQKKYYYLPPANSLRLSKKATDDTTPEFLFVKYITNQREADGGIAGGLVHFLVEWGLTKDQFNELQNKLEGKVSGAELEGAVDLRSRGENSFQIVSASLKSSERTRQLVTSGKAPPMPGGKAAVAADLDKYGAQLIASTFEEGSSISDISLALDYDYSLLIEAAEGTITSDWRRMESQSEQMAMEYLKQELDNKPKQWEAAQKLYKKLKDKLSSSCGASEGFGSMVAAQIAKASVTDANTSDLLLSVKTDRGFQSVLSGGQIADAAIGDNSGNAEFYIGESVMRGVYSFMLETEIIEIEWKESDQADERVNAFRDAFFDYFLTSFAESETPEFTLGGSPKDIESEGNPERDKNREGVYRFQGCSKIESSKQKFKKINLKSLILPIKKDYQMVTNLASTYDQVRNNESCVYDIILDDPFFEHRDVNFIVDIDAKDIFEKQINYVTVDVRKKRTDGNDFNDQLTVDFDYLKKNGARANLTYAKGKDQDPDVFEWRAQWSTRGGEPYPKNPKWQKGRWESNPLVAPIKATNIEFECDIDELREAGIVRATATITYYQYGKEITDNVPLTVSKGNPLMEHQIFNDRTKQGYVYSVIYTNKQGKKVAVDFKPKLNDNYIYAAIPEEWKDKDGKIDWDGMIVKEANKMVDKITKKTEEKSILIDFTDIFK